MEYKILLIAVSPILFLWGLMYITIEISHRPRPTQATPTNKQPGKEGKDEY